MTTSLLVREPVAQYVSFYRYYIEKMQTFKTELVPIKGKEAWGDGILEWAGAVNDIQVRGASCVSWYSLFDSRLFVHPPSGFSILTSKPVLGGS